MPLPAWLSGGPIRAKCRLLMTGSSHRIGRQALRLVGSNTFMKALGDPWIKQHLDLSIRIYETNYVRYRKSVLPELMIGTNIISGVVRSQADLYRVLTNQFKLELPVSASGAPVN
jgi:hypothetical protein